MAGLLILAKLHEVCPACQSYPEFGINLVIPKAEGKLLVFNKFSPASCFLGTIISLSGKVTGQIAI